MLALAAAFVGAFVLSLLLTYLVRGWAVRRGFVDVPDGDRRCHENPVPRLGGVAIYLSFTAVWVATLFFVDLPRGDSAEHFQILALILGGTAIFLVGVWDDIKGLSAGVKVVLETLVAVGLFLGGVRIEALGLWPSADGGLPYLLSLLLTTLWIVGITNAFNLIDGSDGVAGGAALIAVASMVVVFLLFGSIEAGWISIMLGGAILGFLFFNFPPATIFLGDSGSLFIGFTLGVLGVMTTQTASMTLAVAIPVISCGLPILDTLLAMVRRFLRGEHIFQPDRGHIHHRLRDLGHSPRTVALLLYAASAVFALASLLLVNPSTRSAATVVLVIGGVVTWFSIQRLHIPELLEFQRVVHRGFQQRTVIAHNLRIREAIARMRQAPDLASLTVAMADAFRSGEFARVEIWIREDAAPALQSSRVFEHRRTGFRWMWRAGDTRKREDFWEVQLPFRNADGILISRLTVWGSVGAHHLLTDVKLLALELQPEFHRTLVRLGYSADGAGSLRNHVRATPPRLHLSKAAESA
jgi:UDP-GlcNAc:undecaprenyl-phosphate/decaprenyl-phosphate GlcNAc-1-phosphate transferase